MPRRWKACWPIGPRRRDSPTAPPLLKGSGDDKVHLLLVCTAERGLCGGFNSSIVKLTRQKIMELEGQGKTVKILTVGKKGREQLKRDYADRFVHHVDLSEVRRIGYANAQRVAEDLLKRFDAGEFDVAHLFFSRFESVLTQVPTAHADHPASFDDAEGEDAAPALRIRAGGGGDPRRPAAAQWRRADLHRAAGNAASEQGARMTAMDNATRNAGDMIDRLTIEYNRSRQAVDHQGTDRNHLGRRGALGTGDTTHG
jgi:F-type H+-transporting ATPase subunit gamma